MKRKIAALVVFIAIAVMSISGTMAYFTADNVATNVITAGNVDIKLIEQELTSEGLKEFTNKEGVMPGQEISKIVTVRNEGDNPAYVRVSVDKVVTLADKTISEKGADLVTCDFNTTYWTYKDGYYYYNSLLGTENDDIEGNEVTVPLFTTVTFSKTMGNEFQGCSAVIDVYAQAVQAENNGASALEAAQESWPVRQPAQEQ